MAERATEEGRETGISRDAGFIYLGNRIDSLDNKIETKIETVRESLDNKIETVRESLDNKIEGLRKEMMQRFDKMDEKFAKMDDRFAKMDERFVSIQRWLITALLGSIGFLSALILVLKFLVK